MSLLGALNIGQTALAVQQAAIQVTGNNISNAGNADYTRQVSNLSPANDQQLGSLLIGTGVDLSSVSRQINEALQSRLRASSSDSQAADTTATWAGQVESVFNELGDNDLSTSMSTFFNDWSNLANKPQDVGLRQVVLNDGQALASQFNQIGISLSGLRGNLNNGISSAVDSANQLLQKVADLNSQIVVGEAGGSNQANGLRDQRDAALGQLSQLMDISTVDAGNGVTNVFIGNQPLVTGGSSAGLTVKQDNSGSEPVLAVAIKSNNATAAITGGQLGAMLSVQGKINTTLDKMNSIAGGLIFELNKIHASGQGINGVTSVTSSNAATDPTVALNDPKAGLAFKPTNGSFVVHVKNMKSGLETSTLVQVDLDGLNNNDTTLNSLATSLSGITNVSASVVGGELKIQTTNPSDQITFSQDTSGVLAAMGINTFFTGTDAGSIAVNSTIMSNPSLLAAAKNGDAGDNQTAVAIASLDTLPVDSLNGVSIRGTYRTMINDIGSYTASAKNTSTAAKAVLDTLTAQRESLSGVSLDEEAVNLIKQQRGFQAAARLVSAVDEMLKTLLAMT